jgi:hypothetical protein
MVLHDLTYHQKGDRRWAGMPAREYIDQAGEKKYRNIVEFRDNAKAHRFRDAVLAALDEFLNNQFEEEQSTASR